MKRWIVVAVALFAGFTTPLSHGAEPFWERTGGPHGGYVHVVACDSSGVFYAAIWYPAFPPYLARSTDNGVTWDSLETGYSMGLTWSIATTASGSVIVVADSGVFKSAPGGSEWERVDAEIGEPWLHSVYVGPSGTVYIWSDLHAYRSPDEGSHWSMIYQTPVNQGIRTIAEHPGGALFIGRTRAGIARSTDLGATWTQVNDGLWFTDAIRIAVALDGSVLASSGAYGGLFRSTDLGTHWNPIHIGLPEMSAIIGIIILPSGGILVSAHHHGLYLTTDFGASWLSRSTGLVNPDVSSLARSPEGFLVAATAGAGIFCSTDEGVGWQQTGPHHTRVSRLLFDSRGSLLACPLTIHGDLNIPDNVEVHLSGDEGRSWRHAAPIGDWVWDVARTSEGRILAVTEQSGILSSTDEGESWQCDSTTFDCSLRATTIRTVGRTVYVAARPWDGKEPSAMFRSTDDGHSWSLFHEAGLWDDFGPIAPVSSTTVLVVQGWPQCVLRTRDAGNSWDSLIAVHDQVSSILPASQGIFVATYSSGVLRSTDDGVSWSPFNAGLDTICILSLLEGIQGEVYAGTLSGLYSAIPGGDRWKQIGFPGQAVPSLAMSPAGTLFAGTDGNGVYRLSAGTTGVGMADEDLPEGRSLLRNYPNPFNSQTAIRYSMTSRSRVVLRVFDILGRNVTTLVDEVLEAGEHSIRWDASGVAAGLYFIRMEVSEGPQVWKMMLVK